MSDRQGFEACCILAVIIMPEVSGDSDSITHSADPCIIFMVPWGIRNHAEPRQCHRA